MTRVLVIEDNDMLRRAFVRGLRHEGFEVEEAATGIGGKIELIAFRPDVVLLDLQLSDMSGFDWIRLAKPNVPVVIISGRPPDEDLPPCVVSVIMKPIDLDGLAAEIKKVVIN